MKAKLFILGLIFLALIACEKGIENPYSPELPNDEPVWITAEFEVTAEIALSDETPFLNENDYCIFYLNVEGRILHFTLDYNSGTTSGNGTIESRKTFRDYLEPGGEETIVANWSLFQVGSSIAQEWFDIVKVAYIVKLTPITQGHTFIQDEQQETAIGWQPQEVKSLRFTLEY